jgi:indolepyruvate ferredoxin oxidoreductase, beta subunit
VTGRVTSVVFVGVAGQAVAGTARLLAEAAAAAGLAVLSSEEPPAMPGGGSILASVRIGPAASPVVSEGEADVLVAFDGLEALRAAPLLAKSGFAAVNEHVVPTWRMRAGLDPRPADVLARVQEVAPRAVGVRADALARASGEDEVLAGLALLGVVAALLPVPAAALDAAVAANGAGAMARRRALDRGRHLFQALPARLTQPPPP